METRLLRRHDHEPRVREDVDFVDVGGGLDARKQALRRLGVVPDLEDRLVGRQQVRPLRRLVELDVHDRLPVLLVLDLAQQTLAQSRAKPRLSPAANAKRSLSPARNLKVVPCMLVTRSESTQ